MRIAASYLLAIGTIYTTHIDAQNPKIPQPSTLLSWINEADKNTSNAYNIKYWKAKIQLKNGDKAGAIATANEGLKLAMAEPNAEYIRLNKEVLADARR